MKHLLILLAATGIIIGLSGCASTKEQTPMPEPSATLPTEPSAATPLSPTPLSATPAPTSHPLSPGEVEVWLTLGDQSRKLSREANLQFQAGAGAGETIIQVDASVLYQQMEGFGAAMTDSSAWLIMNALTEPARQELMQDLFTRQGDGIGLSYLRLPMGASDFALQNYTYDDLPAGESDPQLEKFSVDYDRAYIIPSLQLARSLNPQLGLLGSPWSPPAWMKKEGRLNGGPLTQEFYQAFADYHVKFVQAYAQAGLPISAITPQNEPMHSTDSYPSMSMPAKEQLVFVRDHLGPAFEKAGLETKILVLDHNWDLWNYPMTILSDPNARKYVDGVAFHCYAGDVKNQSLVHQAYPDKPIWFTECSGGGWATSFAGNMNWNMQNLVIGNFRNWSNSLMLWNLALDENDGPQNGGCPNCRGVVTIRQDNHQVTYNEEYYILGHVSKFVDPGAYRADSTDVEQVARIFNVAFINPDGSMALIVNSETGGQFEVEWNGKHFQYQLPANATVTFKWLSDIQPGPTVTPQATPTLQPTVIGNRPPASGVLQDFERSGSFFAPYNAEALPGEVAYSGKSSLKNHSTGGEWHTVGAYLDTRPVDLSGKQAVCFWVYDATGSNDGKANNSVAVRLIDSTGGRQELWSDHEEVGTNPRTINNEWVQICMDLAAFTEVDLSSVEQVEFTTYWSGDTYFDELTVR